MGESDPSASLVGRKLGAYRVEVQLGEGAMGEVYRGIHESLGRPVAIKTLKPQIAADKSLCERFFAEARAVNIIRHENIVECTDMVHEPGQSYIVMELLEGSTLTRAISAAGRMPARRAVKIGAQIADAIQAAHEKGIVHRDLKTDNVFLIRRAGSNDYVKVLDFGIARLRPDLGQVTATQSGALIGTPAYMSPEQVRGERAGPAADIYALGVMLFQMLTGRLPFMGASMPVVMMAHLNDTPPRVDSIAKDCPPALADVVARALQKKIEDRPKTMAALREALLTSVGIPVDANASMLASASGPIPVVKSAQSGYEATMASGSANSGYEATVASGAGRSSISAASGEAVARTAETQKRSPMKYVIAAVAVLAIGGGVAFTMSRKPDVSPETARPAAPAPARVEPAPPAIVPAVATPDAGAPAQPPKVMIGGGEPEVFDVIEEKKPKGHKKAPVAKPQPAKATTPPPATPPPPEKKKDLTKQLVE